ncbi:HU family DNA-binding protein [Desulforhopalus sp. IMCC35007]|uniref:HU family DNA-binding protein n=1 Tax=Desulforhopalus sp. IMCC35007 TaxID=2569543 RepID=UPI00210F75F0
MENQCGLSKIVSDQVLNSILSTITEAVKAGDKVILIGFAAFSISERSAHEGRNPQTGEAIQIPA